MGFFCYPFQLDKFQGLGASNEETKSLDQNSRTSSRSLTCIPLMCTLVLNKNSLGLLKKGAAKQSRIKNIAWHLRWLVRTRADISLRPSGLVRPRTDIKLRPSAFIRTRTDFKLQTVGLGRSYKD